jgi:hypothetical protein
MEGRRLPPELTDLQVALLPKSGFISRFNIIFHEEVGAIGVRLKKEADEKGRGCLNLQFIAAKDVARSRVLIDVPRLLICLANLTIDPILRVTAEEQGGEGKYQSLIVATHARDEKNGEDRINFRLLTNFTSREAALTRIEHGMSGNAERAMLAKFGATFKICEQPEEKEEGFTTAFKISVMAGYIPH